MSDELRNEGEAEHPQIGDGGIAKGSLPCGQHGEEQGQRRDAVDDEDVGDEADLGA